MSRKAVHVMTFRLDPDFVKQADRVLRDHASLFEGLPYFYNFTRSDVLREAVRIGLAQMEQNIEKKKAEVAEAKKGGTR